MLLFYSFYSAAAAADDNYDDDVVVVLVVVAGCTAGLAGCLALFPCSINTFFSRAAAHC